MSKTLAQLATRVLRNVQIPEDSTTSSVQSLADAKQYLNEAHHDVWGRRVWRESIIFGTFSVPAGTKAIALTDIVVDSGYSTSGFGYNAAFSEIIAVRNGDIPFVPADVTAINAMDPSAWARTTAPVSFFNRGEKGINLLGQFAEATTLSFLGKSNSQDLADGEIWYLDSEGAALLEKATGDMIRDHDRDDNRAAIRYAKFAAEVQALIDLQEVQGANIRRITPYAPWTAYGTEVIVDSSTRTGFSSLY